jgi:hypothetical protein
MWVQRKDGEKKVGWSLMNSDHRQAAQGEHNQYTAEEESQGMSHKGLYTNYQIFTEIFDIEKAGYHRTVGGGHFQIELLFPHHYFRETD